MKKQKYGFIYLWFDKARKRYYLGSHWGTEDDGYVCSSNWMKKALAKRPNDFKRRILERFDSQDGLLWKEQRWLDMMDPNELGDKYYNLNNRTDYLWHGDAQKRLSVGQKISKSLKGRKLGPYSRDRVEKVAIANRAAWAKKTLEERSHTEEAKKKISEVQKRQFADGTRKPNYAMKGKHHSKASKAKSSESNRIAHLGEPVMNNRKLLEITYPDGSKNVVKGLVAFCKENNFHSSVFSKLANGKMESWNGYRVSKCV
jgi:hypothetical protein